MSVIILVYFSHTAYFCCSGEFRIYCSGDYLSSTCLSRSCGGDYSFSVMKVQRHIVVCKLRSVCVPVFMCLYDLTYCGCSYSACNSSEQTKYAVWLK
jgi:hypothetical protein